MVLLTAIDGTVSSGLKTFVEFIDADAVDVASNAESIFIEYNLLNHVFFKEKYFYFFKSPITYFVNLLLTHTLKLISSKPTENE